MRKAFTLTEVLITIVIAAIMMTIAVMAWRKYMPIYKVSAAASQVAADLEAAEGYSLKYGYSYFVVDTGNKTYWVKVEDPSNPGSYLNLIKNSFDPSLNVTTNFAVSSTFGKPTLTFKRPGVVSGQTGSITLSDDGANKTISVSLNGRVRVY